MGKTNRRCVKGERERDRGSSVSRDYLSLACRSYIGARGSAVVLPLIVALLRDTDWVRERNVVGFVGKTEGLR